MITTPWLPLKMMLILVSVRSGLSRGDPAGTKVER